MIAGRKRNLITKIKNKIASRKFESYTPQADPKSIHLKRKLKLRKNFLPTLSVIIILWLLVILIVNFVDPYTSFALPIFLFALFLASFFTSSVLLSNKRRGILLSVGILFILIFRYFGLGSTLNIILITGVFITAELFLSK